MSCSKEKTGSVAHSDLKKWRRETFTGYCLYYLPRKAGEGSLRAARLLLLFALVLSPLFPAAFHPETCAGCHPAEVKLHLHSAHTSALIPVPRSQFALNLFSGPLAGTPLREAPEGYSFTYRTSPDGLIAIAQRGGDRAEGLIQWVFGSGLRGQTPLLRLGDRYLEHRVSFYTERDQYGITTGQENGVSANARAALGILQTPQDLKSCLGCHSAGPLSKPSEFTPGVQCNRCHAGAEEHARGQGKPVNPGKLDHVAQVQLCGTCHRVAPQPGQDNETANIRFQPLRLMKSRCFLEGQIACTTCHAAHVDARRNDPGFYNAKCGGCHSNQQQHIAQQGSANCIGCHMPKRRPHPLLEFTDHFIRVIAAKK